MTVTSTESHTAKRNMLPSDLKQVGVVAKYDVLKYLRSKRLLGMLIIEFAVLALITVLMVTSDRHFTADQAMKQYASFAAILVVIGATLFGGDAIVSEYQGRTGYLLFPNPVKKVSILAGKFIASMGAMLLMLIIYYGVAFAAGFALGGGFADLGVGSLLLAILYGFSALSVAYLISAFMKGSTGALILTFALFIFVFNIASSLIGGLGGIKPWFMLDFAGSSLSTITTWPYPVDSSMPFDIGAGQTMTLYTFYPGVITSILVMFAYAVVSLGLAYFLFKRREMSA